jgi:hypothetical protein
MMVVIFVGKVLYWLAKLCAVELRSKYLTSTIPPASWSGKASALMAVFRLLENKTVQPKTFRLASYRESRLRLCRYHE